ncbi:Na(+)/H(+) antiporter subunit G [compost metagenome]
MDAKMTIEIVVGILVITGTVMTLFSSLGIIRLPDVYNRAHASTKSATLGILCILLGAFLYFFFTHGVSSIRLLLGIVFVFLTAPVAGHIIIRSAHRSKVPLADISVQDDLQDYLDSQGKVESN